MFIMQATDLPFTSRPGDKLYSIAAIGILLKGKILPCWHVFDGNIFLETNTLAYCESQSVMKKFCNCELWHLAENLSDKNAPAYFSVKIVNEP
jgi:hypothetical protein